MAVASMVAPTEARRPGSLWLLLGLLGAACLLGYLWVTLVLPPFNSEHLGCDACHHALMIHALSLPDPAEGSYMAGPFASYPHLAHRLASVVMFAVDNDAYRAMRLIAVICLLGLAAVQYHLFRQAFSAPVALLVLFAWQALGAQTHTADIDFFRGPYYYAQGVGEFFLWLAVACAAWPAASRWTQGALIVAAIGLAAAAYLCHLVPGFCAFGGLGLLLLARLPLRPRGPTLLSLGLLGVVGLSVIIGTGQLTHMQDCKHIDGETPFTYLPVILLWIPTALVMAGVITRRLGRPESAAQRLATTLGCFFVIAALLDGYTAYEWAIRQTVAPYGVKKFFFFLFSAASMLWFLWLVPRLASVATAWFRRAASQWPAWRVRAGLGLGVLALFAPSFGPFFLKELRGPIADRDHSPEMIADRLHEGLPRFRSDDPAFGVASAIYFDPELPQTSVYVNMVGLRRSFADAYQIVTTLRDVDGARLPDALGRLRQDVPFSRLVSPADVISGRQP